MTAGPDIEQKPSHGKSWSRRKLDKETGRITAWTDSMTFQAYIDNIKAKTGKTPEDFKALAAKKGLLRPEVRAGEIVAWLKKDFGLGQGHSMAIYALLKPDMKKK